MSRTSIQEGPQLVGLYNGSKFNGMYHGTIVDGQAYYQGLKWEMYMECPI